ncbi:MULTISPECIES: PRTRC system ThiF family protein [Aeromonas]|uniref:PRTRC system ThiF family protein n=1 Tax=Aeromonas bestiarum TaxID=105751 RepID=A0AAW7I715_9GAMM|nr:MULTISPECIES: PRTRC system ThiF family protein [Aeromonas]MCE9970817.1 PRTRC system ThiF family protein [Aeromonas salmonicida]MDM5069948.1 PRTRC system ThiF family protein [Aeromonas salmonicida]MDM5116376.1 PRTRC system ThiF family protein [Aeromonas salmonicida]MDM5141943.1 PRTRC system ThiF family protein [Aeromonas bestiarum]
MKWKTPIEYLSQEVDVVLIGCGGTGSFVMGELSMLHDLLARLGHPGISVTAYDGSPVREANLGRQRFHAADLGLPKAQALVDAERCYNGFAWEAKGDYDVGQGHFNHRRPTVYITAVDKPSFRAQFGSKFATLSKGNGLWIDAGNDNKTGQVVLGGAGLPTAYDLFAGQYEVMEDDLSKSCSSAEAVAKQDFGVNSTAARIVGQLMWNMFRHGGLDSHGAFFDVHRLSVDPMPIDEKVWSSFGYSPKTQ